MLGTPYFAGKSECLFAKGGFLRSTSGVEVAAKKKVPPSEGLAILRPENLPGEFETLLAHLDCQILIARRPADPNHVKQCVDRIRVLSPQDIVFNAVDEFPAFELFAGQQSGGVSFTHGT